ncbi:MAG: VCBS repeat-containing protein [Planctomycetes bacterium]|nr:VCBS repeat-containing protein [Planctomycetota bacterium]
MERPRLCASCLSPFLLAAGLGLFAACGDDEPAQPDSAQLAAADLARERAAAWFQKPSDDSGLTNARKELAPLVADDDAQVEDLVRAAAVEFAMLEATAAQRFVDRALAKAPKDAAANFLAGQLAYENGDVDRAARHLEATLAVAPNDLPTQLRLAAAYEDLGREKDAEGLYRGIVDLGIENAGDWYIAAIYRLIQLYFVTGQEEAAQQLLAVRKELEDAGFEAPSQKVVLRGNFGVLTPPARKGTTASGSAPRPQWSSAPVDADGASVEEPRFVGVHDLDGNGESNLCLATNDGYFAVSSPLDRPKLYRLVEGRFDLVTTLDLDNDGDLDLLTFVGETPSAWFLKDGDYAARELVFPALPSQPAAVSVVDYDHEGDVDLLLVGDFGARLWRNDGAWLEGGAFVDATAEASLPTDRAFSWCLTEDFDSDQDVDLLVGGPNGAFLADSLRAGKFADESRRLPKDASWAHAPACADVDGDSRPDLITAGTPCRLWRQRADRGFSGEAVKLSADGPLLLADLDGDNAYDLAANTGIVFAVGVVDGEPLPLDASVSASAQLTAGAPIYLEDERLIAVNATEGGLEVVSGGFVGEVAKGRVLQLVGTRDNRRAVGAVVEVRCGQSYRRIYWRGEPHVLAAAGHDKIDVLRITWANGVVQPYVDVPFEPAAGEPALLSYEQNAALVGSCPFLYAWNGETFGFISDVLGATPLGLPIAPGRYVPPDHDEYVLVTGEQLVPNEDGKLVLQFTEELREVTFLDHAKLVAVDHPASSEVFPNELFCFPPFPEHHLHSVEASHAPLRANGSDGRDWTAAVAATDDVHAVPFTKLAHQFSGLAQPWFLELEFDPRVTRDAQQLRLVMTGWFDWSDASANMAAARTPGVDFIPPIFQVPDGEGGWRDCGPPYGFPAGKTKTMVVDVADWLDREDPRMRVFCSLQLYWDRISLATCGDDAARVRTELAPESANLWLRGFSDPIESEAEDLPERFEWERVAHFPRWNQHPGMYTRLGDCNPLLGEVDDRFVILGAGDCLTLTFDARALPPLADGWRRDYLLYLDGWAKDRDHNAVNVLEVEPLPFHAMSGFPYGPDEHFPDDELHRKWRAEWNTRPAHQWIAPVSVRRLADRIGGL